MNKMFHMPGKIEAAFQKFILYHKLVTNKSKMKLKLSAPAFFLHQI